MSPQHKSALYTQAWSTVGVEENSGEHDISILGKTGLASMSLISAPTPTPDMRLAPDLRLQGWAHRMMGSPKEPSKDSAETSLSLTV